MSAKDLSYFKPIMDNTVTLEEQLSKSKQKGYCVDDEKQNNGLIVLEYGHACMAVDNL